MQLNQCEIYLYKSQYVRHVFRLRFTQIKIGHFLLLLFFPFLTSPLYVKRSKTCFFIRFPEYYPPLSSLGFCWMRLACSSWPRDVHLTIVNVLCLSTRVYICRWGRGLVTIITFFFLRLRANSSRPFDLRHDAQLLFAHAGAYISMGVFIYQWDQNTIGMYVFSTENVFVWRTFPSE